MAQCKWCDKKGFFLSVNQDGVCKNCEGIIVIDVQQRMRIINESIELFENSKKMETRLSRLDLVEEHLSAITQYEDKNIEIINPSAKSLLNKFEGKHDKIILEHMTEIAENALTKAEVATTTRTKVNAINKALLKIREMQKQLEEASSLDDLEKKLNTFIHKTQIDSFINEAKKAEFKGNNKKAIDQYQEALYFLKTDNVDDIQQQKEISEIEANIERLKNQ